jgi:hypothetical protein
MASLAGVVALHTVNMAVRALVISFQNGRMVGVFLPLQLAQYLCSCEVLGAIYPSGLRCVDGGEESHHRPINVLLWNATCYQLGEKELGRARITLYSRLAQACCTAAFHVHSLCMSSKYCIERPL